MTTIPLDAVEPRTINIVRTEVERTGIGKNQKPYTLYRVYASEQDGTPITETLKSFEPFAIGPVTVRQEAFVKDGDIKHYTIFDATRKRAVRTPPATTLEDRVASLEEEVAELKRRLNAFLSNPEA